MGRTKNPIPSYLLHQSTGQARVRINGRDHLLGEFGSDESRVRYGALIAQFAAGMPIVDPMSASAVGNSQDTGPSVAEICVAFWSHAKSHYVKHSKTVGGKATTTPTSELHCFHCCLKVVRELYALTPARDFGPLSLKAVRTKMIELGWARKNINRMVSRVRQIFKFAVENEMVDVAVLQKLQAVAPLLSGRSDARETVKRQALSQEVIDKVRPIVRQLVRDLIDLQLLTGARSGELLVLTAAMIDQTDEVWKAELVEHKTLHHGQKRVLFFGPQAKAILSRYLTQNTTGVLLPMTRAAYCRAITRACTTAKIDRWTPHWLRHTFITRTREQFGRDAAQAMAGHASSDMTDDYSKVMEKLASKTAATVG